MKPRLWISRGWWVCGQYSEPLSWGMGPTPEVAYGHWKRGGAGR